MDFVDTDNTFISHTTPHHRYLIRIIFVQLMTYLVDKYWISFFSWIPEISDWSKTRKLISSRGVMIPSGCVPTTRFSCISKVKFKKGWIYTGHRTQGLGLNIKVSPVPEHYIVRFGDLSPKDSSATLNPDVWFFFNSLVFFYVVSLNQEMRVHRLENDIGVSPWIKEGSLGNVFKTRVWPRVFFCYYKKEYSY